MDKWSTTFFQRTLALLSFVGSVAFATSFQGCGNAPLTAVMKVTPEALQTMIGSDGRVLLDQIPLEAYGSEVDLGDIDLSSPEVSLNQPVARILVVNMGDIEHPLELGGYSIDDQFRIDVRNLNGGYGPRALAHGDAAIVEVRPFIPSTTGTFASAYTIFKNDAAFALQLGGRFTHPGCEDNQDRDDCPGLFQRAYLPFHVSFGQVNLSQGRQHTVRFLNGLRNSSFEGTVIRRISVHGGPFRVEEFSGNPLYCKEGAIIPALENREIGNDCLISLHLDAAAASNQLDSRAGLLQVEYSVTGSSIIQSAWSIVSWDGPTTEDHGIDLAAFPQTWNWRLHEDREVEPEVFTDTLESRTVGLSNEFYCDWESRRWGCSRTTRPVRVEGERDEKVIGVYLEPEAEHTLWSSVKPRQLAVGRIKVMSRKGADPRWLESRVRINGENPMFFQSPALVSHTENSFTLNFPALCRAGYLSACQANGTWEGGGCSIGRCAGELTSGEVTFLWDDARQEFREAH